MLCHKSVNFGKSLEWAGATQDFLQTAFQKLPTHCRERFRARGREGQNDFFLSTAQLPLCSCTLLLDTGPFCKRTEKNHRHWRQKNKGKKKNPCFQMKHIQSAVVESQLLSGSLPQWICLYEGVLWHQTRVLWQRYETVFSAFSRAALMADNCRDEEIVWKQKSTPQIYKICYFCYKLANRPICDK